MACIRMEVALSIIGNTPQALVSILRHFDSMLSIILDVTHIMLGFLVKSCDCLVPVVGTASLTLPALI
jgi:hypothetical protein